MPDLEPLKQRLRESKRILPVALAAVALVGGMAAYLVGTQLHTSFDPDKYVDNLGWHENRPGDANTAFGYQQKGSESGLRLDEQPEDNFREGEQDNILDNDSNRGDGEQTAIGLPGSDTNSGQPGGILGIVSTDGTGLHIAGGNGLAGGEGSSLGDGNGSDGSDNGNGNGDPNPQPGGDGNNSPADPNEDRYGINYNAPDVPTSSNPSPDSDEENGISLDRLWVDSGSLMQHFFPGEEPRSEEMTDYVTVKAHMVHANGSDAGTRTLTFKADYTIDFAGSTNTIAQSEQPGSYSATIAYRDKTITLPFDVVEWQLELLDFEEETYAQLPEDYDAYEVAQCDQIIYVGQPDMYNGAYDEWEEIDPCTTRYISLSNAHDELSYRVEERTCTTVDEEYIFQNINIRDDLGSYYKQAFAGWGTEKTCTGSVGGSYLMPRPTESQIVNGVYKVTLYPYLYVADTASDYLIYLNNSGQPVLMGYTGTETALTLPEGIVDISWTVFFSEESSDLDVLKNITSITLPDSMEMFRYDQTAGAKNGLPNLRKFVVQDSNPALMTIDGMVYTKDGKTLLACPSGKDYVLQWSGRVETIGSRAFLYTDMERLVVPATVQTLQQEAFFGSNITNMTLASTQQMTWDTFAFDTEGTSPAPVTNLTLQSATPPQTLGRVASWATSAENGRLNILVPNSVGDEVYLAYMRALGIACDTAEKTCGVSYALFNTADDAKSRYHYLDGGFYTTDNKALQFISPLYPAFVSGGDLTRISDGAFISSTLENIVLQEETPPTLGAMPFGVAPLSADLRVYVKARAAYLAAWGEAIDAAYGPGSAERLLVQLPENTVQPVILDGNLYTGTADTGYTLVEVLKTDSILLTLPAETVAIAPHAFDGCTNLRVLDAGKTGLQALPDDALTDAANLEGLLLPSSLTFVDGNAFAGTSHLNTVTLNTATPPQGMTDALASFDAGLQLYCPQSGEAAYRAACSSVTVHAPGATYDYYAAQNDANGGFYADTVSLVHVLPNVGGAFSLRVSTTRIEDFTFQNHTVLTSVLNGGKMQYVGESAFAGCANLKNVDVYNAPTGLVFGCEAFKDCTSLRTLSSTAMATSLLILPNGLSEMGESAFEGCTALNGVTLYGASQLAKLPTRAFYGSGAKTLTITAAKKLTEIGQEAFAASQMTTANMSGNTSVTVMGDSAFANCTELKKMSLPTNIAAIGDSAFKNCTMLVGADWGTPVSTYLFLPTNLTTLGDEAFWGCTKLASVYDYAPLPEIPDGCFMNCTLLSAYSWSVTATNTITRVGKSAFESCTALANSVIINNSLYFKNLTIVDERAFYASGLTAFLAGTNTGITSIGASAFAECEELVSVVFPKNLQNIGANAFENCTALTGCNLNDNGNTVRTLYLHPTIRSIGPYAFRGCTLLPSVYYYANANVPDECFAGCSSLAEIVWYTGSVGSITDIGEKAFYQSGLKYANLNMTTSLRSIGAYAFAECSQLVGDSSARLYLTLPRSIATLGEGAFAKCTALTSVHHLEAVAEIPDYCFYGCTSLATSGIYLMQFATNLTRIGAYAYAGCTSLSDGDWFSSKNRAGYFTNAVLVDEHAYDGCTALPAIYLPQNMQIAQSAFTGCTGLTSVTSLGDVGDIGESAFAGCAALEAFDVYGNVGDIGASAFAGAYNGEDVGYMYIEGNAGNICAKAFADCSQLEQFEAYGDMGDIAAEAFQNCAALTWFDVYLESGNGGNLGSVAPNAFMDCPLLEEFYVECSVASLPKTAFVRCASLEYVTIADEDYDVADLTDDGVLPYAAMLLSAAPVAELSPDVSEDSLDETESATSETEGTTGETEGTTGETDQLQKQSETASSTPQTLAESSSDNQIGPQNADDATSESASPAAQAEGQEPPVTTTTEEAPET